MMRLTGSVRTAAVAVSADPDPRRAGLLAVAEAAAPLGRERVRGALLFASGRHSASTEVIAAGAAEHVRGATVAVIGGAGVVSQQGESDGASTVVALALTAPLAAAVGGAVRDDRSAVAVGEALGRALAHDPPRPMLLFCRPSSVVNHLFEAFARSAGPSLLAGGGFAAEGSVAVVAPGGRPVVGEVLALRVDGGLGVAVGASTAAAPVTPFHTIEAAQDGYVTRLGGRPPLEHLTEATQGRSDRPLVLALLAPPAPASTEGAIVRGIGGLDPPRGAIHVGSEGAVGHRIAFAVLDPDHARRDMERMLRELTTGLAGAVPLAGVLIDSAGRGARLYGRGGVDSRAIADRLRDVPFAGLRSSFEIGTISGRPTVQSYTCVLALLFARS